MPNDIQSQIVEQKVALSIGVGCILFLVDSDKQPLDKSYFSLLKRELGSIENLTELKMSGEESKFGGVIAIEDEDFVLLSPNVYHTNIDFELHIPLKVQERLEAICDVEHFYVRIYSSYHMPVMYVHGSGSKVSEIAPSTQVILIRRYLAEKLKGKALTVHCIGPRPFHADFACISGGTGRRLIDITEDEGYKLYLFECGDEKKPYPSLLESTVILYRCSTSFMKSDLGV